MSRAIEKKDRIALAVHRYGKDINGGAEDHCRILAGKLKQYFDVWILTSCSKDTQEWNNDYDPGESEENGIHVIRFERDKDIILKDSAYFWEPACPSFLDYLDKYSSSFKAVIFFTIGYFFSNEGMKKRYGNSIFLPTAHTISQIQAKDNLTALQNADAFLFNSPEERDLIGSQVSISDVPYRVTCFGLDIDDPGDFVNRIDSPVEYPYILYSGRVSHSKNFQELNEFFIRYKKSHKNDLKLIVIGRIDDQMTIIHHHDILLKGFVSEDEKSLLMKNAVCQVAPSLNESLSIVVLESFSHKVPVLVNGNCPVLQGQCKRSNGGLYYTSYEEFESELEYMINNPDSVKMMGENGYHYVKEEYNWNIVLGNVVSLIREMDGDSSKKTTHNVEDYEADRAGLDIRRIVSDIQKQISFISGQDSKYELYSRNLIEKVYNREQIVIIGAGQKGKEAEAFFESGGVHSIVCIADNGANDYLSVKEACARYPDAAYIITPKYHMKEILVELLRYDISLENIEMYMR